MSSRPRSTRSSKKNPPVPPSTPAMPPPTQGSSRPAPRPRMRAAPTTNSDKDALATEYAALYDQLNHFKTRVLSATTSSMMLQACTQFGNGLVSRPNSSNN